MNDNLSKMSDEEAVFKLKKAQTDITREYLQGLLQLVMTEVQIKGDLKELTFWKQTVHCDDGAIYQLTFSHVSGPKFQIPPKEDLNGNSNTDLYTGC
jgi:hypothetical protein